MAKIKSLVISWNKDYVKKMKKADFIKAHSHLASEDVLADEYDKIVPPKTDKK